MPRLYGHLYGLWRSAWRCRHDRGEVGAMRDLHIQIYAASTARRARIAELVRRSMKQVSIACVASLSQAVGDAPPDVWIADLETSSAATILLKAVDDWPDGL